MNRLLFVVVAMVCVSLRAAVNIDFSLQDFVSNPLVARTVTITPVSSPGGAGQQIVAGDRISWSTGTNGTFTVSNVVAGAYKVEIAGASATTTFWMIAPSSATSNVPAISILSQPLMTAGAAMAYTAAASDVRYRPVAGTNIVLYTNGSGNIVITASGTIDSGPFQSVSNSLYTIIVSSTNDSIVVSSNIARTLDLSFSNTLYSISAGMTNATWGSVLAASNLQYAVSVVMTNGLWTNSLTMSNSLYSIITSATNSGWSTALSASNALYGFTVASTNGLWSNYLTSSNLLYGVVAAVSNSLLTTTIAATNSQWGTILSVSNALYSTEVGLSNSIFSGIYSTVLASTNALWTNSLAMSNALYGVSAAMTNSQWGVVLTTSNTLYGFIFNSTNAVWANTLSVSNSLYLISTAQSNTLYSSIQASTNSLWGTVLVVSNALYGVNTSISNSIWTSINSALLSSTNALWTNSITMSNALYTTSASMTNALWIMTLTMSNSLYSVSTTPTNINYSVISNIVNTIVSNQVATITNATLLTATNFSIVATNSLWGSVTQYVNSATNTSALILTNASMVMTQSLWGSVTNYSTAATNDVLLTATNRAMTMTNVLWTTVLGVSNTLFHATSLGTNVFFWSPTNDYSTISNSLYYNNNGSKHFFRDGIYYHSGYYVGTADYLHGFFNIFNATNLTIEGLGNPTFIATNCFNIPAASAPDTNIGGTTFNFRDYKNVTLRNFSIVYTNPPFTSTNLVGQSCITLVGTNCSDFLAEKITFKNFPSQAFSYHLPGTDAYRPNHVWRSCEFYSGGTTNRVGTGYFDGACIYPGLGTSITDCTFSNVVRGLEFEFSGAVANPTAEFHNVIIRGNRFINCIESAIICLNHIQIGNLIIEGNIFTTTLPVGSYYPKGIRGGFNRGLITGNIFSGPFYAAFDFSVSAGTNVQNVFANNTMVSNALCIIVDNAGTAKIQDMSINNNNFYRYTSGALWSKGAKTLNFNNNLLENGVCSGSTFKFDVWIRADTSCEVTNLSICNNTFNRTNSGTFTNIGLEIAHGGRNYDIRDNKFNGNHALNVFDYQVNQSTNLDNIPVNNQVRTNIASRISVNGSYRLDGVSADASMAFIQYTRSNGNWIVKTISRSFVASNTPICEVPFTGIIGPRDLFCVTNLTGAGCVTNWSWEYR